MKATPRDGSRGATLIELMVAVVLLAIAVMFMTLVPTQSQKAILKADRVSTATRAARERVEFFRSIVARTGANWGGVDSIRAWFPNHTVRTDTYQSEVRVVRRTRFDWTTATPESGSHLKLTLRCIPLVERNQIPPDSLATQVTIETWVTKRDTLPPL